MSSQRISSGDGFLSFSTTESNTLRFVGLSSGNSGTGGAEIKFALRLQGGRAEVRESGTYKTEVSFAAGDTLKVAVEGGKVKYSKNGSVFYTSAAAPAYPLLVDTSFYDLSAGIVNVLTSGQSSTATMATTMATATAATVSGTRGARVVPGTAIPQGRTAVLR